MWFFFIVICFIILIKSQMVTILATKSNCRNVNAAMWMVSYIGHSSREKKNLFTNVVFFLVNYFLSFLFPSQWCNWVGEFISTMTDNNFFFFLHLYDCYMKKIQKKIQIEYNIYDGIHCKGIIAKIIYSIPQNWGNEWVLVNG